MGKTKIFEMSFAYIYPIYLQNTEKKGKAMDKILRK